MVEHADRCRLPPTPFAQPVLAARGGTASSRCASSMSLSFSAFAIPAILANSHWARLDPWETQVGLSHCEQLADERCMVLFIRNAPGTARSGFTLIEILIVVVILGILAAVVITQFTDARGDANDSSVLTQLQTIRQQIEVYRVKNGDDPELEDEEQWDDLVLNDYLHSVPVNPLNGSSVIAEEPGTGVGWVWRESASDVKQIYATDETFLALYPE